MKEVKYHARNFRIFFLISVLVITGLLMVKNNLVSMIDVGRLREVSGTAGIRLSNKLITQDSKIEMLQFIIDGHSYHYLEWFPYFEKVKLLSNQSLPVTLEVGPAHNWVYSITLGNSEIVSSTEVIAAIQKNNLINLPLSAVFFILAIILTIKLNRRKERKQKEEVFINEVADALKEGMEK